MQAFMLLWIAVAVAFGTLSAQVAGAARVTLPDGSESPQRYSPVTGFILGALLGPMGFVVTAMWVQRYMPDGTPKVTVTGGTRFR